MTVASGVTGLHAYFKQSKAPDNRTVDSNWKEKYCYGHHYSDCPFYQAQHGSSSDGACYLTSACTEARGLPDDCHELTTLRAFRATYVRSQPDGEADIQHYYAVAPQIVKAIHALDCAEAMQVLDRIYTELVQPCIQLIEQEHLQDAYHLYKQYALLLEEKYPDKAEET